MANNSLECYALTARTATPTLQADQTNLQYKRKGIAVTIYVTAVTSTPSVVFTIQGKCPITAQYYDILASAAITGTGTTTLLVYPQLTGVTNLKAGFVLPNVWRVKVAHGNSNSITYQVGAELLP